MRWVKESEEEVGRSKASEGSLLRHPVSFTRTPLEKRGCPGQEQNCRMQGPCFFFNMTVALTSSFMTPPLPEEFEFSLGLIHLFLDPSRLASPP